jgi:2-(1,2-epoxy-1,2-dihydrophenyl)acetyl-CoA isomerase
MSEYELLEFGVDAGIATITLNRPDAANAFNLMLATELNHAATRCRQDPDVRVVVPGANG